MADILAPLPNSAGAMAGPETLLASAAMAEIHAARRLKAMADDLFLPEDARLNERMRATLAGLQRQLVGVIERELRNHGSCLLTVWKEPVLAVALAKQDESIRPRLIHSGLLRDTELMAELLQRAGQDLLAASLPLSGGGGRERPSLVTRFAQYPDRLVAGAAREVLMAENHRRGGEGVEAGRVVIDLPVALRHRLVWWVAAALREQVGGNDLLDRALCEAAGRILAVRDENNRVEVAVMRFAAALDAGRNDLPDLLLEVLGDRRVAVFIALIAHGLSTDYRTAAALVLDPGGERLWLALRALELGRETIARIGYALSQADPRRDLEVFADMLDTIMAVTGEMARSALAPLRLDPAYRGAILALGPSLETL